MDDATRLALALERIARALRLVARYEDNEYQSESARILAATVRKILEPRIADDGED